MITVSERRTFFLVVGAILFSTTALLAANTLRIQGRLTNSSGAPIVGNDIQITASLYTTPDGVSSVWDMSASTSVASNEAGLFVADIGPIPPSVFSSNPDLYLEIHVFTTGGWRTLKPRQRMAVVPFSMRAETAGTADSVTSVGANTVGSAQIINESIVSADLAEGAVQAVNLASSSVMTISLAPGAVTDSKVSDVSATKITGQITSAQIKSIDSTQVTGIAGVILAYGGSSAPAGWLLCDGTAVNRTQYAALFAAISTNFGQGDNSTTFNLPDLRGRFLRGRDGGVGRDPDRVTRTAMNPGGVTGDDVGSVENSNVGPHGHDINDPGHYHSVSPPQSNGVVAITNGGPNEGVSGGGNDGGSFAITVTTPSVTNITVKTSSGTETRPINAYVNYIIKY